MHLSVPWLVISPASDWLLFWPPDWLLFCSSPGSLTLCSLLRKRPIRDGHFVSKRARTCKLPQQLLLWSPLLTAGAGASLLSVRSALLTVLSVWKSFNVGRNRHLPHCPATAGLPGTNEHCPRGTKAPPQAQHSCVVCVVDAEAEMQPRSKLQAPRSTLRSAARDVAPAHKATATRSSALGTGPFPASVLPGLPRLRLPSASHHAGATESRQVGRVKVAQPCPEN